MPIMHCVTDQGEKGYKWGHHGHCYLKRSDAVKQAQAAFANGYKEAKSMGKTGTRALGHAYRKVREHGS